MKSIGPLPVNGAHLATVGLGIVAQFGEVATLLDTRLMPTLTVGVERRLTP